MSECVQRKVPKCAAGLQVYSHTHTHTRTQMPSHTYMQTNYGEYESNKSTSGSLLSIVS